MRKEVVLKQRSLSVTLTANSIAKGDYATFFRLLSAFCTFKRQRLAFSSNFTQDILEDYSKYDISVALI